MTKGLRTVSGLLAVAALAIAPQAFAPQPASTGLTGVCCITNPISCIITTHSECLQQGGIYGGDGSACNPLGNPFGGCTCGPGAGSCTEPLGNGTPGCEVLSCCEYVCLIDVFCCDDLGEWDDNCAAVASMFLVCRCPWDCSAMRTQAVDVPDLLALLSLWGFGPSPCDFDGDGIIAVPDLLKLLANWGPCPL